MTGQEGPIRMEIQGVEVVFLRRSPAEVGILVLEFFDRMRDSKGPETLDLSRASALEAHRLPRIVSNL